RSPRGRQEAPGLRREARRSRARDGSPAASDGAAEKEEGQGNQVRRRARRRRSRTADDQHDRALEGQPDLEQYSVGQRSQEEKESVTASRIDDPEPAENTNLRGFFVSRGVRLDMDPELLIKARRHLARNDAILKPLIRAVGPCTLKHNPNHFEILVRSIISQQISSKAAIAIGNRLRAKIGKFQPKRILEASDADMREAGLSRGKQKSLRDLAAKCSDGTIPLKKIALLEDAEVI